MRRSTSFVVLLCAAAALVSVSAGLAVANGRDQAAASSDGALAVLARSAQASVATGSVPAGSAPTIVTVPDLATTEAPPIPPPTARMATLATAPASPAT